MRLFQLDNTKANQELQKWKEKTKLDIDKFGKQVYYKLKNNNGFIN